MPEAVAGLPTNTLLMVMGSGFLVVVAIVLAMVALLLFGPRARLKRRMAELGLVAGKASGRGRSGNPRQTRIQEKLKELEDKGKKRRRRNQIRADLLQAGIDMGIRNYLFINAGVGIAVGLLYLAMGYPMIGLLPAVLFGAMGLPKMVLRLIARRRRADFTKEFAGAIDIVVRGIRSGLPVVECLSIIGRETPEPVGEEFRRLVEGQKVGVTLEELLRQGLERMPTPEFKFFAIVLLIQQQTGGNLADTLGKLSDLLRGRKKMRDKITALSSEAKSSAAIIGSLPFLVAGMLSLVNPGFLDPMFSERIGQVMLVGGLCWMGLGVVVMRKMINFKI